MRIVYHKNLEKGAFTFSVVKQSQNRAMIITGWGAEALPRKAKTKQEKYDIIT